MKTRNTRSTGKPSSLNQPPARRALPDAGAQAWGPALALVLISFLVYAPALNGGFIWDDNTLRSNALLGDWKGLWRIWTWPSLMALEEHYWPLVYSSFWLENQIGGGLKPFLLHFDNVLLHAATVVLLWRVLVRFKVPGAWIGAALFAVHPVHAESVAWIIERKDVLSGALYFGAALAFLKSEKWGSQESEDRSQNSENKLERKTQNAERETQNAERETQNAKRWYLLALGLFVLALWSKSVAVTLPAALALAIWWREGRLGLRDLRALAPFFIVAALLTAGDLLYAHKIQERSVETSGLALPERILMAGRGLWVYLSKLVWPYPLAMFYPTWPVSRAAAGSWVPLLAWIVLLPALWLARGRIGRGPLAAVVFYGMTLGPTLGIVDFEYFHYSWVADRFQYLASAGPLVLAGAGLGMLARRTRWPAVAVLVALGALGARQAWLYQDSVTFFKACVNAYPQCWPAHAKLALELRQQKRFGEAAQACREGLEKIPNEYHLTQELAKVLEMDGKFDEAETWYRKTLELKPDFANGRIGYGLMLAARGDLEGAKAQYQKELEANPEDAVAMNNLGTALRAQQKLEEAARVLAHAVEVRPQYLDCRYNLALVLIDMGRFADAADQSRQILDINPDHAEALTALGVSLMSMRRPAEAVGPLTRSLAVQPNSPDTLFLLGEVYAMLNQPREAIRFYQETLRLKPNDADAANRLRMLMGGGAAPR